MEPHPIQRDGRHVRIFDPSGKHPLHIPSRVWISSEDAANVADLGYRIVHAPSNYFYLVRVLHFLIFLFLSLISDRTVVRVSGWETTRPGKLFSAYRAQLTGLMPLGRDYRNSWCDPFKSWSEVSSFICARHDLGAYRRRSHTPLIRSPT